MFKIARQNKITQEIINQIRAAILEGKLNPGDKLALEKELVEQFQVSKQTVRESLRVLEHMGLIEVRKGIGGGVFIVEVDMEITKESLVNFLYFKKLSIEDLSEFRKLIEPFAARKAAENISRTDLEKLKKSNDQLEKIIYHKYSREISKIELNFHRILANTTNNPLLILILDFTETLCEDFKSILKPEKEFSRSVFKAHQRIYQAIFQRDPEKASIEMYSHMVKVEDELSKLMAKKNMGSELLISGTKS